MYFLCVRCASAVWHSVAVVVHAVWAIFPVVDAGGFDLAMPFFSFSFPV